MLKNSEIVKLFNNASSDSYFLVSVISSSLEIDKIVGVFMISYNGLNKVDLSKNKIKKSEIL